MARDSRGRRSGVGAVLYRTRGVYLVDDFGNDVGSPLLRPLPRGRVAGEVFGGWNGWGWLSWCLALKEAEPGTERKKFARYGVCPGPDCFGILFGRWLGKGGVAVGAT